MNSNTLILLPSAPLKSLLVSLLPLAKLQEEILLFCFRPENAMHLCRPCDMRVVIFVYVSAVIPHHCQLMHRR